MLDSAIWIVCRLEIDGGKMGWQGGADVVGWRDDEVMHSEGKYANAKRCSFEYIMGDE